MKWSHKKNKRHFDVCEMGPSSSKKERHNVIKQRRVNAKIKTSKGIDELVAIDFNVLYENT